MKEPHPDPEPEEPEFPVVNRIKKFLDQPSLPGRTILDLTPLPASVVLPDRVTVLDLAALLNLSPFALIKVLMNADIFANPAQALDFQTSCMVCDHLGVAVTRAGEP